MEFTSGIPCEFVPFILHMSSIFKVITEFRNFRFATMMLLNDLEKLGSLDQILAATTTLSPSL